MYQKKIEPDIRCPLEYGLELFGGKWDSRIICLLAAMGSMRYSEIRGEMTNITDTALAAALKKLVENGIIERHQYNEIPPRVDYSLTERGKSAVPILRSICKWSGQFRRENITPEMKRCQCCDYKPEH